MTSGPDFNPQARVATTSLKRRAGVLVMAVILKCKLFEIKHRARVPFRNIDYEI
jgi:hypothetical protein